jgi:nucleotide-binding universal stress UspA family protein
MNPQAVPFRVVVGCDFSPLSQFALTMAASVAGPVPGAAVEVLYVTHPVGQKLSYERRVDVTDETREQLEAFIEAGVRAAGVSSIEVNAHVYPGDAAAEILRLAEDMEADLIVVGTHGRVGVKRLLMGSVAEQVMREARCPVLVMRRRQYDEHPELVPEPPCPNCVAVRDQTSGAARWCPVHDRPWVPAHRYAYRDGALHPYHPDGLG